ncbi:MAG: hypothetical protein IPK15_21035 [Verrucomicrobia bacterium]|nr:hypothetical protein [Verrucomicrobiota bacterium]
MLPFNEGQPLDVRFSRSGKVLVAAGGHGAKAGSVVLWNVETGERIASIGKEYDAVLTTDLSPDQARVAMGGTDRLVKIYSTKSGEVEHKIKKHTDWVTAVAFSPNGEMLASGDRNGGVSVWDAESGQELFTTVGHKSAVTALSWRSDSKLVASSSEDGNVTLWESSEGKQAKTWAAHKGGVMSVAYSRDGRFVTCGRDGALITWSADGTKQKTMTFGGEMALRCTWADDGGASVVAGDFAGNVWMWDAKSGKQIGSLDLNPKPLAERIAAAKERLAEIEARGDKPSPAVIAITRDMAEVEAALKKARVDADKAQAEFASGAEAVVRLKDVAAKPAPPADIEAQLTAARAAREKARTWRVEATNGVELLVAKIATVRARVEEMKAVNNREAELAKAKAELEKLLQAQQVSKSGVRQQTKR